MGTHDQLLVIHWPSFGPYHVARLLACQRLAPAGSEVVGLSTASDIEGRPWMRPANAHVTIETACPGQTYTKIRGSVASRGVLRIVKNLKPSAIAINGYSMPDARALLRWARKSGVSTILMSDSKADDSRRFFFKEWIKGRYVSRFNAGLCGGSPHRRYLTELGMYPGRIFDGYDVVDNDWFATAATRVRAQPQEARRLPGLEDERPFFLASSRLIARKNLDALLTAFARYRQCSSEGWRLVILGIGPEHARLVDLVGRSGIPDVTFAGFRQQHELVAYYALAAGFVHPALQEQWGLVINEAMACSLPIIVSRTVGAAYDLVQEGENGFKFDPRDVDALAEALHHLSRMSAEGRASMGGASLKIIGAWSVERFARNMWAAVACARA